MATKTSGKRLESVLPAVSVLSVTRAMVYEHISAEYRMHDGREAASTPHNSHFSHFAASQGPRELTAAFHGAVFATRRPHAVETTQSNRESRDRRARDTARGTGIWS